MNLLQKIESRQGVIAVIGMGYVGLPLAVAFAEAGFRVIGIDVNKKRIDTLNRGESYIPDVPSSQVAALVLGEPSPNHATQSGRASELHHQPSPATITAPQVVNRFSGTTDFDALYNADVVIICVPTPLGKTKEPNLSHVLAVTDEIGLRLHRDMLIILESTTYPGTTEELLLPRLQLRAREKQAKMSGNGRPSSTVERQVTPTSSDQMSPIGSANESRPFAVGEDFFLAFSPERIDPGRTDYTVHNTPKVIGGVTPQCTEVAQALYGLVIEQVVPVSSPKVAEMVKLLENTFRAVNIALVNEVALMCNRLDIDVWEIIEAAKTKPFGFLPFYPGPGLGGHCIPIDPQYLAWKMKTLDYNARFIQLADEINSYMPHYVLSMIADALNEDGKALKGSKVLVLGVAYKADVADVRDSPALGLIHLLQKKGASVIYNDPYVPRVNVDGLKIRSVPLNLDSLRKADCVVITTAHSSYKWEWIVENTELVVDTRNAIKDIDAHPARIVKL